MIRLALAVSLAILGITGEARAINWQGHDDWLEALPHALELKRELRDARPRPSDVPAKPQCQERKDLGKVPDNPYEPVPRPCAEKPAN
jgi:hypothetical protein